MSQDSKVGPTFWKNLWYSYKKYASFVETFKWKFCCYGAYEKDRLLPLNLMFIDAKCSNKICNMNLVLTHAIWILEFQIIKLLWHKNMVHKISSISHLNQLFKTFPFKKYAWKSFLKEITSSPTKSILCCDSM